MADKDSAWAAFSQMLPDNPVQAMSQWGNQASQHWANFKAEHPETALALSVLPVSGQVTAAAEYYDALKRGNTVDGALAAMQMIPFGGAIKGAKVASELAQHANGLAATARTTLGVTQRSQDVAAHLMGMAAQANNEAKVAGALAVGGASNGIANVMDYLKR